MVEGRRDSLILFISEQGDAALPTEIGGHRNRDWTTIIDYDQLEWTRDFAKTFQASIQTILVRVDGHQHH